MAEFNFDGIPKVAEERTPPKPENYGEVRAPSTTDLVMEFVGEFLGLPKYEDSPLDVAMKLGGMGVGAVAGSNIGKGVSMLSKLRIAGTGGAKDAALVSRGMEAVSPHLRPLAPTVEGIQERTLGGGAKASAQAAREAELTGMGGDLTQRAQAAGYQHFAGSDATRFQSLLDELADAGRRAYQPNTGELRTGGGALQTLRSREAILADIKALLPPDLYSQFEKLQNDYAAVATLARVFRPNTRVGTPLGPSGLNMVELQRRVGNMHAALGRLGPGGKQFVSDVFRGGQPPVGDRRISIPLSRHGGIRVPIPLDYLAGPPKISSNLAPYGAILGAAGGGALGGLLSED